MSQVPSRSGGAAQLLHEWNDTRSEYPGAGAFTSCSAQVSGRRTRWPCCSETRVDVSRALNQRAIGPRATCGLGAWTRRARRRVSGAIGGPVVALPRLESGRRLRAAGPGISEGAAGSHPEDSGASLILTQSALRSGRRSRPPRWCASIVMRRRWCRGESRGTARGPAQRA